MPNNLFEHSISYPELVSKYSELLTTKLIAKVIGHYSPVGMGDVSTDLALSLKYMSMCYLPDFHTKSESLFKDEMRQLFQSFGPKWIFSTAKKMVSVADAMGVNVESTDFRVVNSGITFLEAKGYEWNGTLYEMRWRPNYSTDPEALAKLCFQVYFPKSKVVVHPGVSARPIDCAYK